MTAVEDRIVAMKFDNKQFEQPAQKTMSTLDRLKAALNFSGSNKGLNELQASANKFSLGNLASGAQGISSKFLAMSAVAVTAIANIVNRAVDAGVRIAKAFTIDPLKQGFEEYETNLNAVQTILANTQSSGAGLKDVNATLQELNTYSDKTIYNFSEMARNIGTFTAAGVDLKTSAMSIKGIANLAALSGSNSQQASTAMYQLSQAISSGRVSLQDWNSVVNAGMGGTVFQRALAQNAEKMGTLSKGAVELKGKMKNVSIEGKSFRESITAKPGEESWLTSKVLTETLKQFTGDMTDAQLAASGFNKQQIKDIQAQARTAQDAATQVKTFSQLMGTLKESAGSGWAQTFQIILGDFEEAKKLFTNVNDVIGGFIGDSAKARNEMLQTWKDLGGRTKAIKALQNVFKALVQVVTPISKAFKAIFPPVTGKQLLELTQRFLNFTKTLKLGDETVRNIKRTAKGFFAVFSIGWSIIKGILGVLGKLFGFVAGGSGDFLRITARVGDFLVHLDKVIKKGDLVNKFFQKIGDYVTMALGVLREFGRMITGIFTGFDAGLSEGIAESFGRILDRLRPLTGAGAVLSKVWAAVVPIFQKIGQVFAPLGAMIGEALGGIGDAIAKAFKAGDFSSVFDALNTGLLAGIVLLVKKFADKGLSVDFGSGLGAGIKDTFGALTDTLSAMQTQIQAKTLLLIAGAVAILTASIVALSLIDSAQLTKALTAIGVAFGQLLVAMAILTKISGSGGFLKIPFIAGSMILLATAMLILAAAVKVMASMSWEELAKGLSGLAVMLGLLIAASYGLNDAGKRMILFGLALVPLSVGLLIMSKALQNFGEMSWGEIAKAGVVLAGALALLAGGMYLMTGALPGAAALIVAAVALRILAPALILMGSMSWSEIGHGMVVLGASLLIMAVGLTAMIAAMPGASALTVAAAALLVLVPVLLLMGNMSWEAIGKGMVMLGGTLLILAVGLTAMIAALPGAAALIVIAGALAILVPILILLGAMSWETIGKGLAALAGVFLVLGLSALVLTPLVPIILALGAALLVLGLAVSLIGVGLLGIATSFSIFAAAGTAGIAVLTGMINLIPLFLTRFAEGIIGFATTLAAQADKFVKAFASLLGSLLDAVIMILPKVGQVINVLVKTILDILIKNAPKIAQAGVTLMIALLRAIESKVPTIVTLAGNIIVKFLQSMGKQIPRIAKVGVDLILKLMKAVQDQQNRLLDQGAKLIISFINKLASTIRANSSDMRTAAGSLASALISGMTGGISDKAWEVARAAANMVRDAIRAAKDALASKSPSKKFRELGRFGSQGMALGFKDDAGLVSDAATSVTTDALDAVRKSVSALYNAMSGELDMNPTITPILDLSLITQGASRIGSMLDAKSISANVSYRQASSINTDQSARQESSDTSSTGGGDTYLEFKQTINAPTELSATDIYRNTKNQLTAAKEAMK